MLAFINQQCGTYRAIGGSLTATGRGIQALEGLAWGATSVGAGADDGELSATARAVEDAAARGQWRVGERADDPRSPLLCARVDASTLSADEFMARFVARSRPVVLTGAVDASKFARWTTEFFEERLGDSRVHVKVGGGWGVVGPLLAGVGG